MLPVSVAASNALQGATHKKLPPPGRSSLLVFTPNSACPVADEELFTPNYSPLHSRFSRFSGLFGFIGSQPNKHNKPDKRNTPLYSAPAVVFGLSNVALTLLAFVIDTVQVFVATESQPVQPVKVEPGPAAAFKVTVVL